MSDTEYDPSGRSSFSFHVRADISGFLFFHDFFIFFLMQYVLIFNKVTH